jgi:hypothetical protein
MMLDEITVRQCNVAVEHGEACMECGQPVAADNVAAVLWSRERGANERRVIHAECPPS